MRVIRIKLTELLAFTLNTTVDTIKRAYKEDRRFREEINKAFIGKPNNFDKTFESYLQTKKSQG